MRTRGFTGRRSAIVVVAQRPFLLQLRFMFKPNPVEFELPYQEGLLLQVRSEWIAEQKMDGVRAVLEAGSLKTSEGNSQLPGALPDDWLLHTFDGCLVEDVFVIFDVLEFNGEDTRTRPLHERRSLLRRITLPSWCRMVPNGKNIGEFLEAVIHDGGCGIILKNLLETYGNADWIKVEPRHKPELQSASN